MLGDINEVRRDDSSVHPSRTQVFMYRAVLVLLAIIFIMILRIVSWLVLVDKPLTLTSPIRISNQPVAAGSLAYYTVDQCRHTDVASHTIRRLVGDVATPNPGATGSDQGDSKIFIPLGTSDTQKAPVGCGKFSPPPVLIPGDTIPGKYHIEFEIHFQLNPVRDYPVTVSSESFTIIKPSVK